MPAFCWASVQGIEGGQIREASVTEMRAVALGLGVVVGPNDDNPLGLQVSDDPREWGVATCRALEGFGVVPRVLNASAAAHLSIIPLNTIPFEGYEDAVADLARANFGVGIGFDFPMLAQSGVVTAPNVASARHVVRLTPIGLETASKPNVLSSNFELDYAGDINVFDDSEEMGTGGVPVPWRSLLAASLKIGGALWVIGRRVATVGRPMTSGASMRSGVP